MALHCCTAGLSVAIVFSRGVLCEEAPLWPTPPPPLLRPGACAGAEFTCFTSTRVHILTLPSLALGMHASDGVLSRELSDSWAHPDRGRSVSAGAGKGGTLAVKRTTSQNSGRASSASDKAVGQQHQQRGTRRQAGRGGVGMGAAEMLRVFEGLPCALSLIVTLIFLAAYGVPFEEASSSPPDGKSAAERSEGRNGALYGGKYNVSAEMLAWGRAGATLGSGPRWTGVGKLEAYEYDPWRFAPWSQALLRALAALHVVAMACEMASWFVHEWPVIFVRICAEERGRVDLRQRNAPSRTRPSAARARARPSEAASAIAMDVSSVDARMVVRLLMASLMPYYLVVLGIFSILGVVYSPMFLLAHTVRLLSPLARVTRLAAPKLLRTALIALVTLICYGKPCQHSALCNIFTIPVSH